MMSWKQQKHSCQVSICWRSNQNNSVLFFFVGFKLSTVLILSAWILLSDSKAERRRRSMRVVFFCSAPFLSCGEVWKGLLSFATLDVLYWSNKAFVHFAACQFGLAEIDSCRPVLAVRGLNVHALIRSQQFGCSEDVQPARLNSFI